MTVNTGKVTGRRTLRFESFGDVMAEAERVTCQPMRSLGNWSTGEILDHLARSVQESFVGSAPSASWFARTLIAPFLKRSMLMKGLPAGFKLPPTMAAFQPRPLDYGQHGVRRSARGVCSSNDGVSREASCVLRQADARRLDQPASPSRRTAPRIPDPRVICRRLPHCQPCSRNGFLRSTAVISAAGSGSLWTGLTRSVAC